MKNFITVIATTLTLATTTTANAWQVYNNTDSFTGKKEASVYTDSVEGLSCSWSNKKATLVINCTDNKTEVYISTDCYLSDSDYDYDYGEVAYKIDDGSIRTSGFTASISNKALFAPSPIPLTRSLFDHDKITMRFRPYGENQETITFNIKGLKQRIKPLQQACNWK